MNKFLIGLIIGIAIAGGLAVYLNNTPMQFTAKSVSNKNSSGGIGASGPITLAPGTKIQEETAGSANKPAASASSYDFYDVLQGKPASNNASAGAKKAVVERFFVQAGAFSDQDAANDVKAKITLLGLDSRIKADHSGGKIVNRVIIGPLPSESEAQQIIQQLADEQIQATIFRVSN